MQNSPLQSNPKLVTRRFLLFLTFLLINFSKDLLGQFNPLFDDNFGDAGVAYHTFSTNFSPKSIHVTNDHKIVVSGNSGGVRIARFNEDGLSIDSDFGNQLGSSVFGSGFGSITRPMSMTKSFQVSNDKFLVAGVSQSQETSRNEFFIMRINSNGTLDESFGTGGVSYLGFIAPWNNQPVSITCLDAEIASDHYIYVAGNASNSSALVFARCSSDGDWDLSYGQNGISVLNNIVGIPQFGFSLQVMPLNNNKLFVLTADTHFYESAIYPDSISGWRTFPYITRLMNDGSIDSEFNSRRITPNFSFISNNINAPLIPRVESETIITSLIKNADNQLYASAYFRGGWQEHISEDWNSGIFSFNPDGSLNEDWSFTQIIEAGGGLEYTCNTVGMSRHPFSSQDDYAESLLQLADGSIFLTGYENPMATDDFTATILKLNPNGLPYESFNNSDYLTFNFLSNSKFERFIDATVQPSRGILFLSPVKVGNDREGFLILRLPDDNDEPTIDHVISVNSKLQLTPNPAVNYVEISSQNPLKKIQIYDLSGKLLIDKGTQFQHNLTLELNSINSGIYFLKVLYLESNIPATTTKFIKL